MPFITFTEDVPNEEQPQAGPLYKKGYICDVAYRIGHQWVGKGKAKWGRDESLTADEPVKADIPPAPETTAPEPSPDEQPSESEPEETPVPPRTRSGRFRRKYAN